MIPPFIAKTLDLDLESIWIRGTINVWRDLYLEEIADIKIDEDPPEAMTDLRHELQVELAGTSCGRIEHAGLFSEFWGWHNQFTLMLIELLKDKFDA